MKRREFIAGIGSAAAWPVVTRAQQRTLPVIGFLHNQSLESMRDKIPAFQQGLAEKGYVEGRNVAIEHRWAEGEANRRRALIADLIRSQVSVIVADTTNGGADAKAATQTIPIVFMAGADPVEFGLVSSLNRPGGNVTGFAAQGIEVTGKRLELLHKLVPDAAPIAMIVGVPGARVTGDVGARYQGGRSQGFPIRRPCSRTACHRHRYRRRRQSSGCICETRRATGWRTPSKREYFLRTGEPSTHIALGSPWDSHHVLG
jgi:hypothetical protein